MICAHCKQAFAEEPGTEYTRHASAKCMADLLACDGCQQG